MPVTSTRQPVWNESVARGLICLIAFGRSAVKVVHLGIMSVHRNFSRGGNVDISLILFQVANNATQMDLHKTLNLCTHKENSPWKHSLRSHFWNRIQVELQAIRICEKVLFGILYSFCWIGVTSNIIIIVNCRQLCLNWTWTIHNRACGAHIRLCGLNLTFQNLVWNVYYTLDIRNAFSFHKLLNIHFSSTFQT